MFLFYKLILMFLIFNKKLYINIIIFYYFMRASFIILNKLLFFYINYLIFLYIYAIIFLKLLMGILFQKFI